METEVRCAQLSEGEFRNTFPPRSTTKPIQLQDIGQSYPIWERTARIGYLLGPTIHYDPPPFPSSISSRPSLALSTAPLWFQPTAAKLWTWVRTGLDSPRSIFQYVLQVQNILFLKEFLISFVSSPFLSLPPSHFPSLSFSPSLNTTYIKKIFISNQYKK